MKEDGREEIKHTRQDLPPLRRTRNNKVAPITEASHPDREVTVASQKEEKEEVRKERVKKSWSMKLLIGQSLEVEAEEGPSVRVEEDWAS
jgi:hypothetical protein